MRSIKVYNNDILAGVLSELDNGKYSFRYEDGYFHDDSMPEISITLPKINQEFVSDSIFPFFTNIVVSKLRKLPHLRNTTCPGATKKTA